MKRHFFSYPKTRQNIQFIVNADDFGKSKELNSAILKSFSTGLIHRTSLMTNMSDFDDAVKIVHANSSLKNNTGLHINLSEGYPLTNKIKDCKRFCSAEGHFIYKRKQPIFFLSTDEKEALRDEIKAQMQKAIDAGIYPSHVDSHHHVHTEWGISRVLFLVLKEFNIQNIRGSRNMGTNNKRLKSLYKKGFNYYLKNISGYSSTDYFGSINDFIESNLSVSRHGKLVEIMVHPMYNNEGELVDDDWRNLANKLSTIIQ